MKLFYRYIKKHGSCGNNHIANSFIIKHRLHCLKVKLLEYTTIKKYCVCKVKCFYLFVCDIAKDSAPVQSMSIKKGKF